MRRIWSWVAVTVVMAAVLFGISQFDWRSHEQALAPNGPRTDQSAGVSEAGKNDLIKNDVTIGKGDAQRAQEITTTAGRLQLTDEQRRRVRAQLTGRGEARVETADFTISVGASVPRQIELPDLPMELADTLGGYHGSKYLIVRDQCVIIDEGRRIVAIIPNVG